MKQFSIVMPFRDTSRERKFTEKSTPAAIKLNPSEIVIGVDAPTAGSFLDHIHNICKQESFDRIKIMGVHQSNKWNFQLANVIWHCYKVCSYDIILASDVDTTLLPAILRGHDMISGHSKNAVVSFTKRLLIKTSGDLIRYTSYRLRIGVSIWTFSGVYWLYGSYYENVDLAGMQSITNSIDPYMMGRIMSVGRHEIITLEDIESISMYYQNEDYPWRQFQDGIWYGANRKTFGHSRVSSPGSSAIRRTISRVLDLNPSLAILIKVMAYQHPWMLRGYLWVIIHPKHEFVCVAVNSIFYDWSLTGSKFITGLHDWSKVGRAGTGFA